MECAMKKWITREQLDDLVKGLVMDKHEYEQRAEAFFNPRCMICNSIERVNYAGPRCHACYNRMWVRDMRASERSKVATQKVAVGESAIWVRGSGLTREEIAVKVIDITEHRVVVQVPGETRSRFIEPRKVRAL
jgi:hypothetical protein